MQGMGMKTNGMRKPKKWTMPIDDKYDKAHGIKENSSSDVKLDTKRGLASSLAKLRGSK